MKKSTICLIVLMLSVLLISNTESYATRYSIDVKNYEFSPSNLPSVKIGDTLHFEWKNGVHTTTSTTIPAGAAAWDALMDDTHLTFDYVPTVAGLYLYVCTPHASGGMVGQFNVTSSTGMREYARLPKITLYPDPFRDKVYFNCAPIQGVFIQHLNIYDAGGKISREMSFNDRSAFPDHLDLSGVQEGILVFEFLDNMNRSYIVRAMRNK